MSTAANFAAKVISAVLLNPRIHKPSIAVATHPDLASRHVSWWTCEGTGPNARKRWHITSDEISEHSFPALAKLIGKRFTYAVSFHGFTKSTQGDILVGGCAGTERNEDKKLVPTALGQQLIDAINAEIAAAAKLRHPAPPIPTVTIGDKEYAGRDQRNIVNRLANGKGIQIEQSKWFIRQVGVTFVAPQLGFVDRQACSEVRRESEVLLSDEPLRLHGIIGTRRSLQRLSVSLPTNHKCLNSPQRWSLFRFHLWRLYAPRLRIKVRYVVHIKFQQGGIDGCIMDAAHSRPNISME